MDPNSVMPPVNPAPVAEPYRRRSRSIIWPLILIFIGVAILADNFGIHDLFDHAMKFIIPLGMIGIGAYYVMERTGNHSR
jgi:ribose/xylose/arabinose/galactoside ABC-type transport system permease subunit